LAIALVFTGCQKITQEDIDKQLSRWWVIYYKMLEDDTSGQSYELVCGPGGVEGTLNNEFDNWIEQWDNLNLKSKYNIVKRRNELMEEALIRLKGSQALKEIKGMYSLEEAYGSLKEANKAINAQ